MLSQPLPLIWEKILIIMALDVVGQYLLSFKTSHILVTK